METPKLTFEAYQFVSRGTAKYPNIGDNLYYPALGLNGEAGEIAEKVKKIMRDDNGVLSPERRLEIMKEVGDVMWYLGALCGELSATMEECARMNIAKLQSRKERGVLQGSGDNR